MTRNQRVKGHQDKSAELLRSTDLDERLNRIVDRTAKEAAERAKSILREKEAHTKKLARYS